MNFVLKKAKLEKGLYLQIYKSEYDPIKKNNRNTVYKTLGYVDKLITDEIKDPVAYYKEVVAKMNADQKFKESQEKSENYNSLSPEILAGFSPINIILEKLGVGHFIKLFQKNTKFRFDLFKMMRDLISARLLQPCSTYKTYLEVLPKLGHEINYSYDEILDACDFIGSQYDFFTNIMARAINSKYKKTTERVFFYSTNFYFEIEREEGVTEKDVSIKHITEPIVSLGLLLNNDIIPININIYHLNKNEVSIIKNMKEELDILGRTIRVFDDGLNCPCYIYKILNSFDGYLFSESVSKLDNKEQDLLLKGAYYEEEKDLVVDGWQFVKDNNDETLYRYKLITSKENFDYSFTENTELDNGDITEKEIKFSALEKRVLIYDPTLCKKQLYELDNLINEANGLIVSGVQKTEYGECVKYVLFTDDKGNTITPKLNVEKIQKDKDLCGYNLLVTSELDMTEEKIYEVYNQLNRINDTFRTLKSQLCNCAVYLQKTNTIVGHFIINFMAEQLLRIMEHYELNGKYRTEEIRKFIREFRLVKSYENLYVNLDSISNIHCDIAKHFRIPVNKINLSKKEFQQLRLD